MCKGPFTTIPGLFANDVNIGPVWKAGYVAIAILGDDEDVVLTVAAGPRLAFRVS